MECKISRTNIPRHQCEWMSFPTNWFKLLNSSAMVDGTADSNHPLHIKYYLYKCFFTVMNNNIGQTFQSGIQAFMIKNILKKTCIKWENMGDII